MESRGFRTGSGRFVRLQLGLPLDAALAIRRLCGAELGGLVDTALGIADDDRDVDEAERSEAVGDIIAALRDTPVPPGVGGGGSGPNLSVACVRAFSNLVTRYRAFLSSGLPKKLVSDEFDELSLGCVAVELDRHGRAVGRRARAVAERIGLPDDLLEAVERAATLHDIGKGGRALPAVAGPAARVRPVAREGRARHASPLGGNAPLFWLAEGRTARGSVRATGTRVACARTPEWGCAAST